MILAKKVRIRPTKEQEQKLWRSVGTARFVYNWVLDEQEKNHSSGGSFIQDSALRKELTKLKKTTFPWLFDVSNNVAKQAVKDACEAYKKFFKKQAKKPKFKSRNKSKPSFYNDPVKFKVKEECVLLEKVGWIKIKRNSIPLGVKYSNPRVSYDGKYWYVSVGIESVQPKEILNNFVLGIDVGVKDLAVCSDGVVFKNINKSKKIKALEKKLKRKQRKASRKYEINKVGKSFVKTNNIQKLEKEIKLIHRKLTNIRTNHLHQTTNRIARTKPSAVVMETLNIKGMIKNKHLSKAIAQQKLFEFKRQLKYKCEKLGIDFIEADPWFASSKICSKCLYKKKKLSLSERTFKCESCATSIDRDLNASINLSNYPSMV